MKKDCRMLFSGESREPGVAEPGSDVADVGLSPVIVWDIDVLDVEGVPCVVVVVVVVVDVASDKLTFARLYPARASMAV